MIGAIVGDIVGSRFERHNHKSKDFDLFHKDCRITDDSIMTIAIMDAILKCHDDYTCLSNNAVDSMVYWGKKYPRAGYGKRFEKWIFSNDHEPYCSYGNGAAMRVSPCGLIARHMEEAKYLSQEVTKVSHNDHKGLKGAEVVAKCVYMAQPHNMCTKKDIYDAINLSYYDLNFTLDKIRNGYKFDVSCDGTVPVAINAFLESTSFEDAIRNAVSVGGDSDTIAAITGSIAGAYYGIPDWIFDKTLRYLDDKQRYVIMRFQNLVLRKIATK